MANKLSPAASLPGNPMITGLLLLMLIGFLGAVFNAYYVLRHASYDQRYLELTGELRVLSQQIATASREATGGNAAAFDTLKKTRGEFDNVLQTLMKGDAKAPSPQDLLGTELNGLNTLWAKVNGAAG